MTSTKCVKIAEGEWVIVCDGSKALFLQNAGDSKFPNLQTREVLEQKVPPTSAIGSDARTRLSEAERYLEQAVAQSQTDPVAALSAAQQADALAEQAGKLANEDVNGWHQPQFGGEFGHPAFELFMLGSWRQFERFHLLHRVLRHFGGHLVRLHKARIWSAR